MADTKITALATGTTVHSDDWLLFVDTHDTSMASSGTDKKVSPANALAGMGTIASGQLPTIVAGSSGQLQYNSSGAFGGASSILVGANGQLNLAAITNASNRVAGDVWFDSSQLCHVHFGGSATSANCSNAYRVGTIYAQTTNVTITASGYSSLLSTSGAVGSNSLQAGYLNVVGRTIRITMGGYCSSAVSSPGTFSPVLKLGSNVVATDGNSGFTANKSNTSFVGQIQITTKAIGASGKLDITGWFSSPDAGAFTANLIRIANGTSMGSPAPQTQVTLDLTAGYTLDFGFNLSASTNSITMTNFVSEVLA